MKIAYDFHIHSALSPCADKDMTPNNIVNMALLKGLQAIAVTDHNSCGNCAAVIGAAKGRICVLPGLELCTAEEVHVLCLFSSLENAFAFEKKIKPSLSSIKNRPDIFGRQLIIDKDDRVTGEEQSMLLAASSLRIDRARELASECGGIAIPAHIDRPAYGILAMLGFIAPEMGFSSAELSPDADREALFKAHPYLKDYRLLKNSDAHELGAISERENYLEVLACMPFDIIGSLVQK